MINFPFKHLKEVDIDGDTDGQGGGGSAPLTKLDTIKNYVNILYQDYNIEFDIVEETSTQEINIFDENHNLTSEVITKTTKTYKFVPKTNVPRVYLDGSNNNGSTDKNGEYGLNLNSCNIYEDENSISTIIFNDTELTVQQLINYDIIQVGISNIGINYKNENINSYEEYLELLDWFRNNTVEIATIPILLLGEPDPDDGTRMYDSFGLITTHLFLNVDIGIYSQTIEDALLSQNSRLI